ncbi:MAG: glycosyltransferase family 2 protein [Planctomycetota bacterium]
MPNLLTVIIPCKNERRHLPGAIESALLVADEVLVADSGSTDGTLEIAHEMGARVIEREYRTSGDFKNWAIPQAHCPWVLILDADERISPELGAEISRLLAGQPEQDGYWVLRNNCFHDHELRYGAWRPTRLMRFFRRDLGRYVGDTDHAEVEVSTGKLGKLRAPLIHHAFYSYERYLPKLYRYADVQARLWYAQGRRASLRQLLLRGPLRFLQDYFLRRGVLDGAAGLQSSVLVAYGSYLKQARLWELEHDTADASTIEPFVQSDPTATTAPQNGGEGQTRGAAA